MQFDYFGAGGSGRAAAGRAPGSPVVRPSRCADDREVEAPAGSIRSAAEPPEKQTPIINLIEFPSGGAEAPTTRNFTHFHSVIDIFGPENAIKRLMILHYWPFHSPNLINSLSDVRFRLTMPIQSNEKTNK